MRLGCLSFDWLICKIRDSSKNVAFTGGKVYVIINI